MMDRTTSGRLRLTKHEFARRLRKRATPSERLCWQLVRRQRFGFRFRRQVVLYGYIVDFWCPRLKLVIEVDGTYHDTKKQKHEDEIREANLNSVGIEILHLRAEATKDEMQTRIKDFVELRRKLF